MYICVCMKCTYIIINNNFVLLMLTMRDGCIPGRFIRMNMNLIDEGTLLVESAAKQSSFHNNNNKTMKNSFLNVPPSPTYLFLLYVFVCVCVCVRIGQWDVSPLLLGRLPLIYTHAYDILLCTYRDPVTLPINRKPYYNIIYIYEHTHTHTHTHV